MTYASPTRNSRSVRLAGRVAATLLLAGAFTLICDSAFAQRGALIPRKPEVDPIVQRPTPQLRALDAEAASLMRVAAARSQFAVTGAGTTIAVLDTGLRTTHVDFAGRVRAVQNFTTDDGGNTGVVTDLDGHGTNVTGIAAANGIHTGMAPGAGIVACKVLNNFGSGQTAWIDNGLNWVITNRTRYNITVVNMSLGYGVNLSTDTGTPISQAIVDKIRTLRSQRVAVMIAAGNDFYSFGSAEGMAFPAITRESVSVGALYDSNVGQFFYGSGAIAYSTAAGRFTPFSQRLHESTNADCRTDIFAPGAPSTSAGSGSDTGESTQHGTSQATPAAAGVVLLAQQYYRSRTGQFPTIDQLETWMRSSSVRRLDGDDEDDNVANTNKSYATLDAVNLLTTIRNATGGSGGGGNTTSNITAAFASNTLTVTGTSGADVLTIRKSGNTVTLTPGTGTKINNTTSFSFTAPSAIAMNINLGEGNDSLSLMSALISNGTIDLGAGNDAANLNYCTATTLSIAGGTGTDTVVHSTSRITNRTITGVP